MGKRKKEVTTLEFSDGEIVEIAGSIRDLALDQMQAKLESLGVPAKDIAAARIECIKVNNDKPFVALFSKRISAMRF